MKPDLEATTFSPQNAFYFARLANIAYKPKNEAKGLVKGNSTSAGLGFDRFHWFEASEEAKKSSFDAIQDTEAYVCANDDMIVIVFRGTKEKSDWATNLDIRRRDCPSGWAFGDKRANLHEGFDDGVETVWGKSSGMYKTVKDLYDEKNKNRKLYITGHSLGAALATITGARLAFADDMNVAGMYTIGSPKLFDSVAAEEFNNMMNHGTPMKDKFFRCTNNNDIVPRLPPGFYHAGTEIYLDRFGSISTNNFWDRLLGRFSALSRGQVMEDINDHATSEYIRHFKQAVINSKVPLSEKAISALNDAVGGFILQVAPSQLTDKSDGLQKLKKIRTAVDEVKGKAKEAADKEALLEF
ncbi:unnamed protein product [Scytosiphon promiscuus]